MQSMSRLRRTNKPGGRGTGSPYAYGEYPELEGLTDEELTAAIHAARLAPDDAQIAIGRLIWRMCWADIGAAVHMDRTTARRRLARIIIPRLIEVQRNRVGA